MACGQHYHVIGGYTGTGRPALPSSCALRSPRRRPCHVRDARNAERCDRQAHGELLANRHTRKLLHGLTQKSATPRTAPSLS